MNTDEPREITLTIMSEDITVLRRLRARWTREAEEDLRAYHNVDAESLLSALLSEFDATYGALGGVPHAAERVGWLKEGF